MLSRNEPLEIMEQLMANSTGTAGPSAVDASDVFFFASVPGNARTGSFMFCGCPSRPNVAGNTSDHFWQFGTELLTCTADRQFQDILQPLWDEAFCCFSIKCTGYDVSLWRIKVEICLRPIELSRYINKCLGFSCFLARTLRIQLLFHNKCRRASIFKGFSRGVTSFPVWPDSCIIASM